MSDLAGTYYVDSHQAQCLTMFLHDTQMLSTYIKIDGHVLTISNVDLAGSGASFLIAVIISLLGYHEINLRQGGILDARNARAFAKLIERFYVGI